MKKQMKRFSGISEDDLKSNRYKQSMMGSVPKQKKGKGKGKGQFRF